MVEFKLVREKETHEGWVTEGEVIYTEWYMPITECMNCKKRFPDLDFKYCPNCGEKVYEKEVIKCTY